MFFCFCCCGSDLLHSEKQQSSSNKDYPQEKIGSPKDALHGCFMARFGWLVQPEEGGEVENRSRSLPVNDPCLRQSFRDDNGGHR